MKRSPSARPDAGTTLVELIVALAILGVMAAVTAVALREAPSPTPADLRAERITRARHEALEQGHRVSLRWMEDGVVHHATALPDGRVLADSGIAVDASDSVDGGIDAAR